MSIYARLLDPSFYSQLIRRIRVTALSSFPVFAPYRAAYRRRAWRRTVDAADSSAVAAMFGGLGRFDHLVLAFGSNKGSWALCHDRYQRGGTERLRTAS